MEPERRIEKLLRDYARKRRDEAGPPPELDPATRRLLQAEAARPGRHRAGGNRLAKVFLFLRPKLVYALCGLAAIILGVWLLMPEPVGMNSKSQLAYGNAESMPEAASSPRKKTVRPPSAKPPPPKKAVREKSAALNHLEVEQPKTTTVNLSGKVGNANRKLTPKLEVAHQSSQLNQVNRRAATESTTSQAKVLNVPGHTKSAGGTAGSAGKTSPAQGRQPMPLPQDSLAAMTNADRLDLPQTAAGSTVATGGALREPASFSSGATTLFFRVRSGAGAPAGSSGVLATASFGGTTAGTNGQRFVRPLPQRFRQIEAGLPAASAGSRTTPVLDSFDVEQSGSQLRIVDKDGSVYAGYVERGDASPKNRPNALENATLTGASRTRLTKALGPADGFQTDRIYFFRVAGTNRSLNQSVVFAGKVLPDTNTAALNPLTETNAFGRGQFQRALVRMPPLPLANSRINGTAVIDNRKQIQINAVPLPSQSPVSKEPARN